MRILYFNTISMLNFSIINFIVGWVLWFLIDKHPASLGTVIPEAHDTMLANFQLAFDMLAAGYLRASYVFIWKAHYIVLSIIFALLLSSIYQAVSNVMRRHHLRQLMWPKKTSPKKASTDQARIEKQESDDTF
ncbi:MAG TPA: hypothetical protein ENJ87_04855 [Gammaproteobacteria bacterium]|nr:hypothetical protein [Gammaproteobacteria bacterium]